MPDIGKGLSLDLVDARGALARAEMEFDGARTRIVRLMGLDCKAEDFDGEELDRAVEALKAAAKRNAAAQASVDNLLRALRG